jgi:hypothetical protein
MEPITVQAPTLYDEGVSKANNVAKLPVKAGEVGSYGDLAAWAVRGDKLTPYSKGGSLVLPESEHFLTRTFGGRGSVTLGEDAGLSFRQILYKDIKDVRSIAGSKYNDGLTDLIDCHWENFPQLMKK